MGIGRAGACLVGLLLSLGLFGGPRIASAQGFEFGGGLAQVTNPPAELFEPGNACPPSKSWAGEGRIAYRFSRAVSLEGTGGYNWASNQFCVLGPEPVPANGPFTVAERTNDGGFPYFSTDARLAFEPSSPSGPMWLRVFGGWGAMWSKDTQYWLAGGGLVIGGQVTTVFEAEWNWFDLPYVETLDSYQDGALVSSDSTTGQTGHTTFRIRAGFRWRF
ncbi:MAG: hypothetical protein R3195_16975 [Gemmatimonadota bacterium]|nr:hypothetical protein [Gemmatimonadota bacterium]